MTFSQEIKQELLNNKMGKKQFISFLQGIIFSACKFESQSKFTIRFNKPNIAQQIRNLLNLNKISYESDSHNKNWITIESNYINIEQNPENVTYFFAGLFLGGGSISKPTSRFYHLEIAFLNREKFEKIKSLFQKNNLDLNFHSTFAHNKFILYLKKINEIIYFLMAIRATERASKLEEIRIERDYRLNSNRLTNFDIHNLKRVAQAATKHIENYEIVLKNNKQNLFSQQELTFFELRKNNPDLTLEEIKEILKKEYNIVRSKSGLNHWLMKLKNVIKEI